MASADEFENHVWKDVISAHDLRLYAPYARRTFVGPSAAFLAIDLYSAVYQGEAGRPVDLDGEYPNSSVRTPLDRTHQEIVCSGKAGGSADFLTALRRRGRKTGRRALFLTKRDMPLPETVEALYGIYHEFKPHPSDVIITKQRASSLSREPLLSHLNLLGIRSLILCG